MKIGLFALIVSLTAAAASAGQKADATTADVISESQTPAPGWSLTPSLLLSRMFDDNVLLQGPGDPRDRDYINVLNPRGELTRHDARGDVAFRYDGAFVFYNNMSELNSYDQHGGVDMKRRLSKRSSFFLNASVTAAPTTELLQLTGVPYVRAGVFSQSIHAGFQNDVSKRLTIIVDGSFDQARFDANTVYANELLGGHGIGGAVSLHERLDARTSLTADADVQHETIGTAEQQFDIQHVLGGIERQLTEDVRVYAAGGFSRLSQTSFSPSQVGPSVKLGLTEHYRSTLIDVSYLRSYVPSFGFGGTMQNGSFTARVRVPITRRIYTQNLVSWQREDPIVIAVPPLRSTWIQSSVGYVAQSWIRIEAYFADTRQTAGRVDGELLTHNQYGIQVIAGKPMRIR